MKTKVVILGVNHAYQLVSKECQPAVYRAFFDRVKPDVFGIERSPEEFSTSNFYEFTYEQQNILVPYSRERGIPLRPFDWLPSSNDQLLAWNTPDIEQPQFIRGEGGYKNFIVFPQLEEDFFYSENLIIKEKIIQWRDSYTTGENDFPRRLFQYRTYMQAMRIKSIAEDYHGGTVLIVVGHMHKPDIEGILSSSPAIEIIKSSDYGYPEEQEIRKNVLREDLLAICSFNLLGVQSKFIVDTPWLENIVDELKSKHLTLEVRLFDIKQKRISNKYPNMDFIALYENLLECASEENITYTGVKHLERIDSYFDPFGNVSLKNRLRIELMREHLEKSNIEAADNLRKELLSSEEFSPLQKKQLEVYLDKSVDSWANKNG